MTLLLKSEAYSVEQSLKPMFILLPVLWGLKTSLEPGDSNRCRMVVLFSSTSGLFSLKVISTCNRIMAHLDIVAYSCEWQMSEIRSPADTGTSNSVFHASNFVGFSAAWRQASLKTNVYADGLTNFKEVTSR